jgi:hypothetical protein
MIRIRDRIAGAILPLVVVVHALRTVVPSTEWRLLELHASGDIRTLWPSGMLALENSLPQQVDWLWLERFALLIDEVETIKFVAVARADDSGWSVECVDSSYWEITGPGTKLASLRGRFDAVDDVTML